MEARAKRADSSERGSRARRIAIACALLVVPTAASAQHYEGVFIFLGILFLPVGIAATAITWHFIGPGLKGRNPVKRWLEIATFYTLVLTLIFLKCVGAFDKT